MKFDDSLPPDDEEEKEFFPEDKEEVDELRETLPPEIDHDAEMELPPPDIDMGLTEDFVEYWKTATRRMTDAHWSYKEMTALYLISTMTRWNWHLFDFAVKDIFADDVGGRLLNVWICLLGKSRLARKSTMMRFVEQVIDKVGYSREVDDQIVELRLPDDFNSSTFVQAMNMRRLDDFGEFSWATWIDDEISRFFEQMVSGGPMAGIAPILSKIYDPYSSYSRITRAHGTERINRSYLTMLVASTEALPQLFTEYIIRQGFINRIMFAISNLKEREPRKEEEMYTPTEEFELMVGWLKTVKDINFPVTLIIPFKGEAKDFLNNFEQAIDKQIIEDEIEDLYQGYVGNLPAFLVQLACLYRISRMPYLEVSGLSLRPNKLITVELEDLKRAKKLVDVLWENFKQVVRIALTKKVVQFTYTQESNQIVVFEAIVACATNTHKGKDGWAKRSEVGRKTRIKSETLDEILTDMEELDYIKIDWDRKRSKRPTQLLKTIKPPI